MALASPMLYCLRTQTAPPATSNDFVSRQAQKLSFGGYGPLCMPSSRARSFFAAQWLAHDNQPQIGYSKIMMQIHASPDAIRSLATVLVCKETVITKMARRFPQVLSMDPEDVFSRLIQLKTRLPNCNVAGMVLGQPLLFLGRPGEEVTEQVAGNYHLFSAELPLLDVDTVVQEKPAVLFIAKDMLLESLPQLRNITHPHSADSTTVANLIWATFGRALEELHSKSF